MSIAITLPTLTFGRRRKLPMIFQSEAAECGLACMAMVAGYHGHATDLLSLRKRYSFSLRGATLKALVEIATVLHLTPRSIKIELDDLAHVRRPCILHWDHNHFVVLKKVITGAGGAMTAIVIHDPGRGEVRVARADVSRLMTGIALELVPTARFEQRTERQRIGLRQLVTSAVGLRGALLQILMLAMMLEAFALLAPLFLQFVADGPISSGDRHMLTVFALGFGLLMVVQMLIGAFRSWVVLYISTHLNLQWVAGVFAHLLRLPLDFFEKRHMGDVISRFNSIHSLQETLSTKFIEAVLDGMLALTAMAVMLVYSVKLTAVVFGSIALYSLLRWLTFLASRRANEEQLISKASEQSVFLESIRGMQALKLFNHEQARHARWMEAVGENINRRIVTQKLDLFFATATRFLTGAENIVVIWLGAHMVIDQQLTLGMLYAFIAYKLMFSNRTFALIDKFLELKMLSLHGERLADIVLTPPESDDEPVHAQAAAGADGAVASGLTIELRNVSYRYSDAEPWIVRNLSLTIASGQSVAIVGQSGCGKTTLLKLMIGILTPVEGEILIDGQPAARFGMRRYRDLIGVVMQDDHLFAGSIADNISFFHQKADQAMVEHWADLASVGADIRAMPMAYRTLIGDMGTSLSGGQKQRLLLARALYKQPRMLFLDEATSHLDMENEHRVNAGIHQLDLTRVIVAHRQETIASAARVVALERGCIVSDTLRCDRKAA